MLASRRLWHNIVSLYSVQFANYFVPLFTVPFLARILGPAGWGALAFAEAYASYVTLVVEYGFGLSASRTIARSPHLSGRAQCASGVISAQAVLILLAAAVTVPAYFFIPSFGLYRALIPLAFCLGTARAASPFWYFQGVERMAVVSGLNLLTNLLAAGGMFLLVRGPDDAWIPLAVRVLASGLSAIVGFAILLRETPGVSFSIAEARSSLAEGGALFLFRGAISLYTTANILILGAFRSAIEVAWYAGAEKISRAAINAIQPLGQAFYPRLSSLLASDEREAGKVFRLSAVLTISAGFAIGLMLYAGAPLLVRLALGRGFAEAVPVLRIFSLLPPLVAISNAFGMQWMLAMRLDGLFNRVVLITGIVNTAVTLVIAPLYGHNGVAVTAVLADIGVAAGILLSLRGTGSAPWATREGAESAVGAAYD